MYSRRIFILIVTSFICIGLNRYMHIKDITINMERYEDMEWEALIWAICQVESGCDDQATNPSSSAAGRFQMLRGYVDEVNRIQKKNIYHYQDRFDSVKARQMFDIYQAYYNPEKSIDKAIILHRGKVSYGYINKIKNEIRRKLWD